MLVSITAVESQTTHRRRADGPALGCLSRLPEQGLDGVTPGGGLPLNLLDEAGQ